MQEELVLRVLVEEMVSDERIETVYEKGKLISIQVRNVANKERILTLSNLIKGDNSDTNFDIVPCLEINVNSCIVSIHC